MGVQHSGRAVAGPKHEPYKSEDSRSQMFKKRRTEGDRVTLLPKQPSFSTTKLKTNNENDLNIESSKVLHYGYGGQIEGLKNPDVQFRGSEEGEFQVHFTKVGIVESRMPALFCLEEIDSPAKKRLLLKRQIGLRFLYREARVRTHN